MGPESVTSTLECERHFAGRLIGPKGSKIRELRDKSGADIQVKDGEEGKTNITIKGSEAEVEAARQLILAIVDPPSATVECDSSLIGRVIGPRGATIREIQSCTGAGVNVDRSGTITITGTPEQIEAAREWVVSIVNPPTTIVECDPSLIGRIIGPRGATIREIQDETGADVNVDRSGKITLSGTDEAIEAAKEWIDTILNPPRTSFTFPRRFMGRLIGAKGAMIRRIQDDTGARVDAGDSEFAEGSNHGSKVSITGSEEAVQRATEMVKAIVQPITILVPCPRDCIGALIGDDGQNLIELRQDAGDMAGSSIDIGIDIIEVGDDGDCQVRIECSNADAIAKVKALVEEEISQAVAEMDYTGDEGRTLRAEANEWALKRSNLLEQAAQEYEQGDKQHAKKLSEEATAAGKSVREVNKKASVAVFNFRNEECGEEEIDLHGLHVREALGFLKQRIAKFLANDEVDRLTCITGAGNHSPGNLAKIRPAVARMCSDNGLSCQDDGNPGTFIITC